MIAGKMSVRDRAFRVKANLLRLVYSAMRESRARPSRIHYELKTHHTVELHRGAGRSRSGQFDQSVCGHSGREVQPMLQIRRTLNSVGPSRLEAR